MCKKPNSCVIPTSLRVSLLIPFPPLSSLSLPMRFFDGSRIELVAVSTPRYVRHSRRCSRARSLTFSAGFELKCPLPLGGFSRQSSRSSRIRSGRFCVVWSGPGRWRWRSAPRSVLSRRLGRSWIASSQFAIDRSQGIRQGFM